tara:strand:+ start:391 stop:792 length:402 start_codon:yes stop_codon:yes gene_type:complete
MKDDRGDINTDERKKEFFLSLVESIATIEREKISDRTKHALAAAKSSGVKLGADKERALTMSKKSAQVRRHAADMFALGIFKEISKIKKHSSKAYNNSQMADALNRRHILTSRGKLWYSHQVARVLSRAKAIT